jgi:hypothetical protein
MTSWRAFCPVLWLALAMAGSSQGQQEGHPSVATITFDRLWEAATPQEFIISTQSDGPSRYLSRNPQRPVAGDEEKDSDYGLEFTMSQADQQKIFKLAREANYFNGDFDYKSNKMAKTGKKTLTYADESRHFEATYNYSTNKAIDELTGIFLGISATIEHGRKLSFLRRFDRLGLEAELKGMEDEAANHSLAEIQVIAPTLKSIAEDSAILNIARQRARRLLAKAER